ncbi:hypothetical protein DSO57_1008377 [Entomophthora muscae]|uniref:Uncharacterized protein n=1 Tax=Entomophthora muscae TaxID=34485 RepID=A0ACC2RY96_9FUNG|nr:hypothetical protein DSO57_1008377 [Entomophthora muscae]
MQTSISQILKTWWGDWATAVVIIVTSILIGRISPPKAYFSLDDSTIQYPYTEKELISEFVVVIISLGIPMLVVTLVSGCRSSFITLHHGILGILSSGSVTLFIVNLTKVSLGEFRPDWIARCNPILDAARILTSDSCKQTDLRLLRDGQKSFMSGHAGASFAGFFFLSLFLATQLGVFSTRRSFFRATLVMAPLAFPLWVSISRIADYRHHPHDVIAGAITGILAASVSYFLYSPTAANASSFEELELDTKQPCHLITPA